MENSLTMENSITIEKNKIRTEIARRFKADKFTKIQKAVAETLSSSKMCEQFWSCIDNYEKFKTIFAYLPLPDEFPTEWLLQKATEQGKTIGLPVVEETWMIFRKVDFSKSIRPEIFFQGYKGIYEPRESNPLLFPSEAGIEQCLPLLVIAPGRAFTKDGKRLGRGGGYYDFFLEKLLAQYREQVRVLGLCYSFQVVKDLPMAPHDMVVDAVITESILDPLKRDPLKLREFTNW